MLKKHPPKRSDDALEQKPKHEEKKTMHEEREKRNRTKEKKNTKIKKTEQTELKIEGVKHKDERCRKYIRNKTKTKKVHTNKTEKEM